MFVQHVATMLENFKNLWTNHISRYKTRANNKKFLLLGKCSGNLKIGHWDIWKGNEAVFERQVQEDCFFFPYTYFASKMFHSKCHVNWIKDLLWGENLNSSFLIWLSVAVPWDNLFHKSQQSSTMSMEYNSLVVSL